MSYLIKSRVYIFTIISSVFLITPFIVFGAGHGGLVTCSGLDCGLDELVQLATVVIDNFIKVVVPSLAGLAFMVAGFYYIVSAGDPNRVQRAHEIFKYTLLGIVISLAAWLIIRTIINAFGVQKGLFNLFG